MQARLIVFALVASISLVVARQKNTAADTIEGLLMASLQTGSEFEAELPRDAEEIQANTETRRRPLGNAMERDGKKDGQDDLIPGVDAISGLLTEHLAEDEVPDAALTVDLASNAGTTAIHKLASKSPNTYYGMEESEHVRAQTHDGHEHEPKNGKNELESTHKDTNEHKQEPSPEQVAENKHTHHKPGQDEDRRYHENANKPEGPQNQHGKDTDGAHRLQHAHNKDEHTLEQGKVDHKIKHSKRGSRPNDAHDEDDGEEDKNRHVHTSSDTGNSTQSDAGNYDESSDMPALPLPDDEQLQVQTLSTKTPKEHRNSKFIITLVFLLLAIGVLLMLAYSVWAWRMREAEKRQLPRGGSFSWTSYPRRSSGDKRASTESAKDWLDQIHGLPRTPTEVSIKKAEQAATFWEEREKQVHWALEAPANEPEVQSIHLGEIPDQAAVKIQAAMKAYHVRRELQRGGASKFADPERKEKLDEQKRKQTEAAREKVAKVSANRTAEAMAVRASSSKGQLAEGTKRPPLATVLKMAKAAVSFRTTEEDGATRRRASSVAELAKEPQIPRGLRSVEAAVEDAGQFWGLLQFDDFVIRLTGDGTMLGRKLEGEHTNTGQVLERHGKQLQHAHVGTAEMAEFLAATHCSVFRNQRNVYLMREAECRNGLWLNDGMLSRGQFRPLRAGDRITIVNAPSKGNFSRLECQFLCGNMSEADLQQSKSSMSPQLERRSTPDKTSSGKQSPEARRSRKEDLGLRPLGTADLIRPATPPEMRLRVEEVIRGPSPGPIQGEAVPDEKDDA